MEIRLAQYRDLPDIVAIYNQAVTKGFMTADTDQWKIADKQEWFAEHQQPACPIFVATEDDRVVGYATISPYRPGRGALSLTKEIGCYIDHHYLRNGIGMRLLQHAINKAPDYKAKTLVAIVLDANLPSIALLRKAGFELWGHLPNIASFNGVSCGHVYYGLHV